MKSSSCGASNKMKNLILICTLLFCLDALAYLQPNFGGSVNISARSAGKCTLVAGVCSAVAPSLTSNSIILLTAQSGVLTGVLKPASLVVGEGFDITSTILTDTAVIGWVVIN